MIYIGDGIVTTGDADPVAFNNRLRRLYQDRQGTMHAVAVSSSFESMVLKTIASVGRGSFRRIAGEQGPQAVARELLAEIAQPVTRIVQGRISRAAHGSCLSGEHSQPAGRHAADSAGPLPAAARHHAGRSCHHGHARRPDVAD